MYIDKLTKNGKTFIVAEIGNNHEGDFNLAKQLISLASDSGADAVKFQTFIPEYYVNTNLTDRIKAVEYWEKIN